MMRDFGAIMSPQNGFISYIGSDTLALRMERHSENAKKIAAYLKKHPKIDWINHPSLPDNKYHKLAMKYMPNGQGGMMSFGIKGSAAKCAKLKAAGVPYNLIRLSVGIENAEDIIADLEQALEKV